MKVVLATDSLAPSGVGEHMLLLAGVLEAEVVLALPDHPDVAPLRRRAARSGFAVKSFDPAGESLAPWLAAAAPDILHVHAGIGWEGHGLVRDGVDAGLPVVRTEHLPFLLTDAAQAAEHGAMLEGVARLIAVSDGAAETFRVAGVSPAKLRTVRNGVAPVSAGEFSREALALGRAAPLLLTVARLTPQKGHATLFAALANLRAEWPDAALLLAGEGAERGALEALADALGIGDAVRFLGHRDDVPALMAASDMLVLPSLFEGLPLVLLEAMAEGLTVVATRAVGSLEAVGESHPFLADVGDAPSLRDAIRRAWTDEAARDAARAALRERFRSSFSAARMGAQTRDVYHEALALAGGPKGRGAMARTRIGFIGAGGIAHRHLGVLEQFEDVELAAFADADFERARGTAERFGARAFADHAAMLDEAELDAVYVCVPPFAHGAIERDVIARGLPFFVEKPVSLDIETAREIERAVREAGLVTAVGYHWRYLDTVDEARELFQHNPPRLLSGYWLDQTPPPEWWWHAEQSGGQMVEQTTHILDLARVLAGEVDTVFGLASHTERPDFPGLDVATVSTASLRFQNGAVGNFASTCLLRWGHRVGLHLFGDGLAVEMTDHDIMVDVGRGRPTRRAEGDPVWREDRDFVDAVQGKENRIRCPYAEALKTHELALAVNESARTGQPIRLGASEGIEETTHV